MDSIHLHGAEDVRSAASTMRSAAETISSAASSIDCALDRHHRFLDDWLQRLELALDEDRRLRCAAK
jgi:hypothetical protein